MEQLSSPSNSHCIVDIKSSSDSLFNETAEYLVPTYKPDAGKSDITVTH